MIIDINNEIDINEIIIKLKNDRFFDIDYDINDVPKLVNLISNIIQKKEIDNITININNIDLINIMYIEFANNFTAIKTNIIINDFSLLTYTNLFYISKLLNKEFTKILNINNLNFVKDVVNIQLMYNSKIIIYFDKNFIENFNIKHLFEIKKYEEELKNLFQYNIIYSTNVNISDEDKEFVLKKLFQI